jgi:hypothetical protein
MTSWLAFLHFIPTQGLASALAAFTVVALAASSAAGPARVNRIHGRRD